MALPTFVPPIGPTVGTSHKPDVNLYEAEFGDGYSQPTPKGINHIRKKCSLKWDVLLPEQADEIEDFFEVMAGNKVFFYAPYGTRGPIKWTCKEWSRSQASEGVWMFSAELVQSFTNAT